MSVLWSQLPVAKAFFSSPEESQLVVNDRFVRPSGVLYAGAAVSGRTIQATGCSGVVK